jgi:hypothetical protein
MLAYYMKEIRRIMNVWEQGAEDSTYTQEGISGGKFRDILSLLIIIMMIKSGRMRGRGKWESWEVWIVPTEFLSQILKWRDEWGRPDLYYCQTVAGLLMCGALSDEMTGLSFAIAAGTRQRSHSRVRVPWNSRP